MTVYLDNAASSPVFPEVRERLAELLETSYANPSAGHRAAYDLRRAIEQAERDVLALAGTTRDASRVVWCSGGTEANNLAILGTAHTLASLDNFHAVTSGAEHPSILRPLAHLSSRGATVARVPVHRSGQIDLEALAALLSARTTLVALGVVQNETGVVQDLAAIREILDRHAPQARLHLDAVQAFPKLDLAWAAARATSMSISGHKFHGPGGTGALLIRRDAPLAPLLHGGGQQDDLRSGSLDGVGILALTEAARVCAARREALTTRVRTLNALARERSHDLTQRGGRPIRVEEISPPEASPWICMVSLPNCEAAVLARLLGEEGVIVGTGSACSAESKKPSAVLSAMGFSAKVAFGALRFSFGYQNTEADVERCFEVLQRVLASY